MYKFKSRQISFTDFNTPIGMKLNPDNRWVKKAEIRNKKQDYIDETERIEIERKFSLAKRKCGIGLIVTRLEETTCHCLAMSILLLNLRKLGKVLFTIFLLWFQKLLEIYYVSKLAIIQ